jgi:hypothetical protein
MPAATSRVTVLMTPADKRALTNKARQAGVSVGELLRRSALDSHRAEENDVLAALAMLRESNAKASAALDTALANIARREAEWTMREQRAVKEGRALAAELGLAP